MKTYILIALILFLSCRSEGWTKEEQTEFVKNCTAYATGNLTEEQAQSFCKCSLKKTMEKFKTITEYADSLPHLSEEEQIKLYQDCID